MKKIVLLTVGTTKDKNIISLEKEFTKRISLFDLKINTIKAHGENRDKEAKEICNYLDSLSKKESVTPILLTEHGKEFNSHAFADFINKKLEHSSTPVLIIGGNAGFPKELLEKKWQSISLSQMTFPHQFAKIMLVEQLYRAETIIKGHPYSK